jgi:hypothetical protein
MKRRNWSFFEFLSFFQFQLFIFLLFRVKEEGIFTATCHTSKTRLSEKFEIRFSHPFSAPANAH